MNIGEKIRKLREEKEWSQYRLAKVSGVRQGNLSQIEAGIKKAPTADTLRKICAALGVSMAEFDDTIKEKDLPSEFTPDDIELLRKIKSQPEHVRKTIETLANIDEDAAAEGK